jgi:signal transduction histidine kinase/CheY-like chemotaxis protein
MKNRKLNNFIKGKIIIAFLISLVALYGAYFINNKAFSNMQHAISNFSHPHKKLQTINKLLVQINASEQLYKNLISGNSNITTDSVVKYTATINSHLDTLLQQCTDNPKQYNLVDSIRGLISERQKLWLNYTQYRLLYKNNWHFKYQVSLLDSLLSSPRPPTDSLVITNEQIKTITIVDTIEVPAKKKKGLWANIMGKTSEDEPETKRQTVEESQIVANVDTLVYSKPDTNFSQAKLIVGNIASEQTKRRQLFFNKDLELAAFESVFNNTITQMLTEVENEIIQQLDQTNFEVHSVISRSQKKVNTIIMAFLLFGFILVLLMLSDISKSNLYRKQVEKAMDEAERQSQARQRFLSNMSHELRTPLQSVIGYAQQVTMQPNPNKADVEAIHTSAQHLLRVVNEILDYNRIALGKFVVSNQPFNLQQVINEVITIIKPQAVGKGLYLQLDNSTPLQYTVLGDAFRLKQVLLNLLGNSVKFTSKGGITLAVNVTINHPTIICRFGVTDTGIGISPEHQLQVFDYFDQGGEATGHFNNGSGIGLSIVKALIEAQGGTIALDSEPGKGTCFTFNLNYTLTELMPLCNETFDLKSIPKYKGHVWLVDDDALILKLCSTILTKYAIPHTCFNSPGAVLLDKGKSLLPTLLFIDIRMAGTDGLALHSQLTTMGFTTQRFIALTAQALPEEQDLIRKQGFNDILLKPFTEAELLKMVFDDFKITSTANDVSDKNTEDANIMAQFVTDTSTDILAIQQAIMVNDVNQIAFLLHRLAGRTLQMGQKELGLKLRKLELDFRHPNPLASKFNNLTETLHQLNNWVTQCKT